MILKSFGPRLKQVKPSQVTGCVRTLQSYMQYLVREMKRKETYLFQCNNNIMDPHFPK